MSTSKITAIVLAVLFFAGIIIFGPIVFETFDTNEMMSVQSLDGTVTWHTGQAGIKFIGFGHYIKWPRLFTYEIDQHIKFNDAGNATLKGSIQVRLPQNEKDLSLIYKDFGTPEGLIERLIERSTNKVVYLTGNLMSSRESYAEKRGYLVHYIQDQLDNGVYKTVSKDLKTVDPITGAEKTIAVSEIVTDSSGVAARQEIPPFDQYNITTYGFAIDGLPYDEAVEAQIKEQQKIMMDVQTAIADARKAEQRTITVTEQGKADAAVAKWAQEVQKATAVTSAEKVRDSMALAVEAAELYKQEKNLRADADASYRRKMMESDGALEQKLATYQAVSNRWAEAFEKYPGKLVSDIVMGGESKSGVSNVNDFMTLMTAKTAKDLSLDMSTKK